MYSAVGFSYADDEEVAPPLPPDEGPLQGEPPLPPGNPLDEAQEAVAARFGLQGFAELLREAELQTADEDAARALRLRYICVAVGLA